MAWLRSRPRENLDRRLFAALSPKPEEPGAFPRAFCGECAFDVSGVPTAIYCPECGGALHGARYAYLGTYATPALTRRLRTSASWTTWALACATLTANAAIWLPTVLAGHGWAVLATRFAVDVFATVAMITSLGFSIDLLLILKWFPEGEAPALPGVRRTLAGYCLMCFFAIAALILTTVQNIASLSTSWLCLGLPWFFVGGAYLPAFHLQATLARALQASRISVQAETAARHAVILVPILVLSITPVWVPCGFIVASGGAAVLSVEALAICCRIASRLRGAEAFARRRLLKAGKSSGTLSSPT